MRPNDFPTSLQLDTLDWSSLDAAALAVAHDGPRLIRLYALSGSPASILRRARLELAGPCATRSMRCRHHGDGGTAAYSSWRRGHADDLSWEAHQPPSAARARVGRGHRRPARRLRTASRPTERAASSRHHGPSRA